MSVSPVMKTNYWTSQYVSTGKNSGLHIGERIFSRIYTCMTHTISPLLSNRQKQVIMGTILGGSSIVRPANGKNCYLSMRGKSERWLKFKAEELSSLASWKPFTVETTNRWHSMCYPIFNDYFQMFYVEKQRHHQHRRDRPVGRRGDDDLVRRLRSV
jgi:hypothetical protein